MRRSILGVVACVGVLAGGCKREPPPASQAGVEAAQAGGATTGAGATPAAVEAAPAAPKRPAAPEVRPEVLALREARRLAKAGELRAAWEAIGPVARSNKSDGHLLCEAGFIAHRAGSDVDAEALLRRGVGLLARDNTRPGRNGRAMCLYNLALLHEAAGRLGEAVCELRRSEKLRANKTVAAKRRELEGKIDATSLRCAVERVARSRDVREVAREWAQDRNLKITGLERATAGGFAVHIVRLATAEEDEQEIDRYEDVGYVVLDDSGRLFPLGVLGYNDRSYTYFRGSASFELVGSYTSPLGALVVFELGSSYIGDSEQVESGNGISSHSRDELLVCRRVQAPDDVACAQVPLGAQEEADAAVEPDDEDSGLTGAAATGPPEAKAPEIWGGRVSYRYDEAKGEFVFEVDGRDREIAEDLGLPVGSIAVRELFERHAADTVGIDL